MALQYPSNIPEQPKNTLVTPWQPPSDTLSTSLTILATTSVGHTICCWTPYSDNNLTGLLFAKVFLIFIIIFNYVQHIGQRSVVLIMLYK